MVDMMKVRIDGELVDREVAHMTIAIHEDGTRLEYPEPKLDPGEVVFQSVDDLIPIIVMRTNPA